MARPAAIYGPDNNIYDMELPMFLRLLQRRPILVPHGGLVVGSYGHVDDLCEAMIAMACSPAAAGEVFNVTAESVDVNRYVAVLASVVGAEPDVVHVPDELLPELAAHRARRRRSGTCSRSATTPWSSIAKVARAAGRRARYDLVSGHAHTYDWFRAQGYDRLARPLVDPVWKATWDFEARGRDRRTGFAAVADEQSESTVQSLTDAEIHRAVATTVHDVLLPALPRRCTSGRGRRRSSSSGWRATPPGVDRMPTAGARRRAGRGARPRSPATRSSARRGTATVRSAR